MRRYVSPGAMETTRPAARSTTTRGGRRRPDSGGRRAGGSPDARSRPTSTPAIQKRMRMPMRDRPPEGPRFFEVIAPDGLCYFIMHSEDGPTPSLLPRCACRMPDRRPHFPQGILASRLPRAGGGWPGDDRPRLAGSSRQEVRAASGDRSGLDPPAPDPGEASDLSVHARRSEPPGDVRPQARPPAPGADSPCRRASAPWPPAARWPTNPLLATRRTFRKCGQSGIEVSDFLPHIAGCADDLAVIRSCWADSVNHPQAVYQMNTGSILMGKPSLGSWVSYGLGTENQDLPAFVVLPDPGGGIKGGPPAYGAGFLPASHQGTVIRNGASPILDLRPAEAISGGRAAADPRPDRPAQRPPPASERATTPSSPPGSSRTSWPIGCRARPPRPSTWRASRRRPRRSTASTTAGPPSSARAACWPAGWSSAASGSSSSTRAT